MALLTITKAFMNAANFAKLVALAAIWGGSFLFMRLAVPTLGPVLTIEGRLLSAALFLAVVALLLKKPLMLRKNWKHFLILGFFNSGLPFLLFAYAAQTLSASMLSVLNATAALWGALITAAWTRQRLAPRTLVGLALGIIGVALLVGFDHVASRPGAGLAIAAGLTAAFCYGIASLYAKLAPAVDPFANTHGSMWGAALVVLPALALSAPVATPSGGVLGAVLALGVLCSGIAYLMYFKLIADVGAASALAVTFLTPLFGILWGCLFLHEVLGWYTLPGAVLVISGTALTTGFRPDFRLGRRATGSGNNA